MGAAGALGEGTNDCGESTYFLYYTSFFAIEKGYHEFQKSNETQWIDLTSKPGLYTFFVDSHQNRWWKVERGLVRNQGALEKFRECFINKDKLLRTAEKLEAKKCKVGESSKV